MEGHEETGVLKWFGFENANASAIVVYLHLHLYYSNFFIISNKILTGSDISCHVEAERNVVEISS